jgi:hypothetical protein
MLEICMSGSMRGSGFNTAPYSTEPSGSSYKRHRRTVSIKSMYDASYEGTHWIATYIVDYLISQQRRSTATTQPHR